MFRLGGADETVIGNAQTLPQFLKADNGLVAVLQRLNAPFFGGVLDFLTVFIRSSQKECIIADGTVKSCQHVSEDRGVGVTDVGPVINVVMGVVT